MSWHLCACRVIIPSSCLLGRTYLQKLRANRKLRSKIRSSMIAIAALCACRGSARPPPAAAARYTVYRVARPRYRATRHETANSKVILKCDGFIRYIYLFGHWRRGPRRARENTPRAPAPPTGAPRRPWPERRERATMKGRRADGELPLVGSGADVRALRAALGAVGELRAAAVEAVHRGAQRRARRARRLARALDQAAVAPAAAAAR